MSTTGEDTFAVVGGGVVGFCTVVEILRRSPSARVTHIAPSLTVTPPAATYAGAVDLPLAWSPVHEKLVADSWSWHREGVHYRTPHVVKYLYSGQELGSMIMPAVGEIDGAHLTADSGRRVQIGRGFQIDPREMLASLKAEADSHPGYTRHYATAASAELVHGKMSVATTPSSGVEADKLVIAIGPWLSKMPGRWGEWARNNSVRNKRVFGARLVAPPYQLTSIIADLDKGLFAMPTKERGEVAVSLLHEEWDVDAQESSLPLILARRARSFLSEHTGVANWRISRPAVFADAYTPAAIPIVGTLDSGKTLLVTGTHGSGVRLAPGLAMELCDRLLGSKIGSTYE